MIALDFFLYDNRTWSPRWGRDWGLKAATGVLANRADLKAGFDRYCGAMTGEQGQLCGFGEAIGGVRPQTGDGYLLCVTLECSDSFGRPSWAVIGLWCPDSSTLEQLLSAGDPIGSARTLLSGEIPSSAVEIRQTATSVGPKRRRRATGDPTFHDFNLQSSAHEVISLLLGAVRRGTALPNVLGITASSRLLAVARAGFDVVYCRPMDDRTERALARVRSPKEPEEEELSVPPAVPTNQPTVPSPDSPPRSRTTRPNPNSPDSLLSFSGLIIVIGILSAVGILLGLFSVSIIDTYRPTNEEKEDRLDSEVDPEVSEERSTEALLDDIRERLDECEKLDPEALRKSPGFLAAETLEVLSQYENDRDRVRLAYSDLIELRGRMVPQDGNSKYVAYYYENASDKVSPATKLKKIAEILKDPPDVRRHCEVLEKAFGFEFENEESVVRQWCDSLKRLEETSKTAFESLSGQKKSAE